MGDRPPGKKKITTDVDADVWKEFHMVAIDQGVTLAALVEGALRLVLENPAIQDQAVQQANDITTARKPDA
jgi:hypothetical protein